MVHQCLAAADLLEEDAIDAEVIDIRTMTPLDTQAILDSVRKTYDGPLSMAQDMMVWNITRNEIRQRMTVAGESTLAIGERKGRPDTSLRVPMSQWLQEGKLDLPGVNQQVLDQLSPGAQKEIREEVPPLLLPE